MAVKIHLEADTVSELHQHIIDLSRIFTGQRMPELEKTKPAPTQQEIEQAEAATSYEITLKTEVVGEQPSAPKKRGRKPKSEANVAEAPSEVSSDSETTAVSDLLAPQAASESQPTSPQPQYPTREAAVDALRKITDKFGKEENGKGILLCRAILEKFEARKISEIPEEKRAEFIETCAQVVETGEI